MGLSISVNLLSWLKANGQEGYEQLQQKLAEVNTLLEQESLPIHIEPEISLQLQNRGHLCSFPYGWLHYLRRVIAYWQTYEPLTPCLGDPIDDRILQEEYYMLSSHIICHSDASGFYVPIDFSTPLGQAGDQVGSSYRVMRELIGVASLIGIDLSDDGQLSNEQAAQLNRELNEDVEFGIERQVWFTLYETAQQSISNGTVIVFH